MKNIAFIAASILTLTVSGFVSAESVTTPRPAQVVLQFAQSIPPEPSVAAPHSHGSGCCQQHQSQPRQAQGCCESRQPAAAKAPQKDAAGCCCRARK